MPTIEINDQQILRCLDQLSPEGKKTALRQLLGGLERLDRLVEKNRERLDAVCKARGVDFGRLTEEERERFVDHILHESA
ncbi:MAG: hypothetical protein E8D42_06330 [Nitrospira sp.]|nr:MAG: hypothetical protein E8D42_06330 [Nitrospira sp.]